PDNAPPKTMYALFVLYLKTIIVLISAMVIVRQSVIVSLLITKHTDAIIATDATLTASKKADNPLELRILFIKGLSSATNTNEGRNIATVEINAPDSPLI